MDRRIPQKRHAKTYEQPELSEDEVHEIREAFNLFAMDGSGRMDLQALHAAMESLGFEPTSLRSGDRIMDQDDGGSMDFETFLDMMTSTMDSKPTIQKVFHLFDHDQTGKLSLRNLKRVAKELGETMTEAELLEMIERADTDQDGEINADEFYAIMTKKTYT